MSDDNGEIMVTPLLTDVPVPKTRRMPPKSLGRPEFDKGSLEAFDALPPARQREELKASWASAAFVLADRLRRFSMTVSKKDFGRLQQLATSAGVAYDKVFPKGEAQSLEVHGNVMFNLFGTLGGDKVMQILSPPVPKLKEIPNGEVHPAED